MTAEKQEATRGHSIAVVPAKTNTINGAAISGQPITILNRVVYDVCSCCGKPKRGTGRSMGGVAFWVTKAFVRNREIIDFPDQWRRLCESVGFKTVCIIRAWQTTEYGVQLATEHGKPSRKAKQKKSFFRHNDEMNAQAIKHWEQETHKAMYVDQARKLVEDDYKNRLARYRKKHKAEEKPPVKPTTKRVQHLARKLAYRVYLEAGNAREVSGVEIDFEQVIVMVK